MTRPRKQTVDYFPHDCNHGKTMFIVEQRYGNDGYAFWFKLLEQLGNTEKHFLDLNDKPTWEFLLSRAHLDAEKGWEIMNLLADLGAIDPELWESKVVWIENFVKRVTDAYRNRLSEIPIRPVILRKKPLETPQSDVENPQTKLKETKEKENTPLPPSKSKRAKKPEIPLPDDFGISDDVKKWATKEGYNHLEAHLEYFRNWATATGKRYISWDAAFKNAIMGDWGHVREKAAVQPKPLPVYKPPHIDGLMKPVPNCPKCGGKGIFKPDGGKYAPCTCLHPEKTHG